MTASNVNSLTGVELAKTFSLAKVTWPRSVIKSAFFCRRFSSLLSWILFAKQYKSNLSRKSSINYFFGSNSQRLSWAILVAKYAVYQGTLPPHVSLYTVIVANHTTAHAHRIHTYLYAYTTMLMY